MNVLSFDVAVIGGSLGGVQAARAACEMGLKVYLCEETDWIGGQLTSQAVPPDEHDWIEEQGATASYLRYRKMVRDYYRSLPQASPAMRGQDRFCPGNSWVSRLAHSPRLAHALLCEELRPYEEQGLLTLQRNARCVSAQVRQDKVESVTVRGGDGEEICVRASYFLDATDMGDLLPLTGTEYRVGAESRAETEEPHAPQQGDSQDQQPVTWVAALALDKERQPMERPDSYGEFSRVQIDGVPLLGWTAIGAQGLSRFAFGDGENPDKPLGLWSYRRIQYPPYYTDGRPEISLLNWPQNDYVLGSVVDNPRAAEHLRLARELTRCCAYWLWEQGYPVRLDGGETGTKDGLAKAPYIRESRRILALHTIREQEIAERLNPRPVRLRDSVGVGHYAMDLHLTTRTHTSMYQSAQRFEIPLSAMIPVRMKNLLPACKNIGATHITGGCFRLHPVEWTVGEAAGYLAAYCLRHGCAPRQVLEDRMEDFQALLAEKGFQLHWKEEK